MKHGEIERETIATWDRLKAELGRDPLVRELAECLGVAKTTAQSRLRKLKLRGLLDYRVKKWAPADSLSETRALLLKTLSEYWEEHGCAPRYADLADELEVGIPTVSREVGVCRVAGWIKSKHFHLQLSDEGRAALDLWLCADAEAAE